MDNRYLNYAWLHLLVCWYFLKNNRVIETDAPFERPAGIDWEALSEERIEEIPVLAGLRS